MTKTNKVHGAHPTDAGRTLCERAIRYWHATKWTTLVVTADRDAITCEHCADYLGPAASSEDLL